MMRIEGEFFCAPYWPPPEYLRYHGSFYHRVSYSQITDEKRAELTSVFRGAEYQRVEAEDSDLRRFLDEEAWTKEA